MPAPASAASASAPRTRPIRPSWPPSRRAQGELSSALSRLLVVTENYPDLKSNQNFLELQSQLEGTENRITVARNRYIASVQEYNTLIRSFPVNLTAMMFGYEVKPNFSVENEAAISKPPTVRVRPGRAARGAGRSAGRHRPPKARRPSQN